MALCTAIFDADTTTPRKMPNGWGWWHVECMTEAAQAHEAATRSLPLLEVWSYPSLQSGLTITYAMGFKDPEDGEVFILNKGDRLEVWRDR